jgi:hypothetical protein
MPNFEPGKTIWVVLRNDRNKPDPPKFKTRSLSLREQIELTERVDAMEKLPLGQFMEALQTVAGEYVTDWSGLSRPFQPGDFADVLNLADMQNLINSVIGQVEYEEKKA